MDIECLRCGLGFKIKPSRLGKAKYCSAKCRDEARTKNKRDDNCLVCGDAFTAYKDHGAWQKFCSRECYCSQENHPIDKHCEYCSKSFRAYYQKDKNIHHKYCSRGCASNARKKEKETRVCDNCDSSYLVNKSTQLHGHTFCSRACQTEFLIADKNPLYKGVNYKYINSKGACVLRTKEGWRLEHRVVVEEFIGRKLNYWSEPILHINGNKSDNSLDNLYVCSNRSEMGFILNSYEVPYPVSSNVESLKK